MRIACCTPSRGLVHSRTEEAVEAARREAALDGYPFERFYTHDLPIPDCFNMVTQKGYDAGADVIWLLEEDVVPWPETFIRMIEAIERGADIAVTDYPMRSKPVDTGYTYPGLVQDGAGRVTWCRTGCIMFKRHCLDAIPRPWFTTETSRLIRPGEITWSSPHRTIYGCDIAFTNAFYQLGYKFAVIEPYLVHLEVIERGAQGTNCGAHRIRCIEGPNAEYINQVPVIRELLTREI